MNNCLVKETLTVALNLDLQFHQLIIVYAYIFKIKDKF